MTTTTPTRKHPTIADERWHCTTCGVRLVPRGGYLVHDPVSLAETRQAQIGWPR